MITEIGGEMSEELERCPFCGEMPETDGRFAQCYLMPCDARHFIMPLKSWQKRPIEDALKKRITELEAAGAKLADAAQDLINALPLDFSDWEIVPVHKALLEWNEINKELDK